MSYIAALRSAEGIVLIADTQETVRDEKQYSEKLGVSEDAPYPLAVGGAGVDELTDAFSQELLESVLASRPKNADELIKVARTAIETVHAKDMAVSALTKQYRTGEFLIGAKPSEDDFVILRVKGRRVFLVRENFALIGFATAANKTLLSRMYREGLTMHRAVLLGAHLVSQSKARDLNVGGKTRIAIVGRDGAYFEEKAYIANVEARAEEFSRVMDDLFLECTDLSIRDDDFPQKLEAHREQLLKLRNKYKHATATWMFLGMADFARRDRSYPYLSGPFSLTLGTRNSTYSETAESTKRIKELIDSVSTSIHYVLCGGCKADFEYKIVAGERPVRGKFTCPLCGALSNTIGTVASFRKIGDAAWIEIPTPSNAQKSEPEQ